jgi:hypothetical protein
MFPNLRALLKSHPISGCLFLVVTVPIMMIVLALLPPLAYFLVSWLLWTQYFLDKDKRPHQ